MKVVNKTCVDITCDEMEPEGDLGCFHPLDSDIRRCLVYEDHCYKRDDCPTNTKEPSDSKSVFCEEEACENRRPQGNECGMAGDGSIGIECVMKNDNECEAKKEEETEKEEEAKKEEGKKDKNSQGNTSQGFPWWIFIIIGVVLMLLVIVVIYILYKKKKKKNENIKGEEVCDFILIK
jgi:hypothetical protein